MIDPIIPPLDNMPPNPSTPTASNPNPSTSSSSNLNPSSSNLNPSTSNTDVQSQLAFLGEQITQVSLENKDLRGTLKDLAQTVSSQAKVNQELLATVNKYHNIIEHSNLRENSNQRDAGIPNQNQSSGVNANSHQSSGDNLNSHPSFENNAFSGNYQNPSLGNNAFSGANQNPSSNGNQSSGANANSTHIPNQNPIPHAMRPAGPNIARDAHWHNKTLEFFYTDRGQRFLKICSIGGACVVVAAEVFKYGKEHMEKNAGQTATIIAEKARVEMLKEKNQDLQEENKTLKAELAKKWWWQK